MLDLEGHSCTMTQRSSRWYSFLVACSAAHAHALFIFPPYRTQCSRCVVKCSKSWILIRRDDENTECTNFEGRRPVSRLSDIRWRSGDVFPPSGIMRQSRYIDQELAHRRGIWREAKKRLCWKTMLKASMRIDQSSGKHWTEASSHNLVEVNDTI